MEKCRLQQNWTGTEDADSELLARHCGVCESGFEGGNQLLAEHPTGVPGTESEKLLSKEKHIDSIGEVKDLPKNNSKL